MKRLDALVATQKTRTHFNGPFLKKWDLTVKKVQKNWTLIVVFPDFFKTVLVHKVFERPIWSVLIHWVQWWRNLLCFKYHFRRKKQEKTVKRLKGLRCCVRLLMQTVYWLLLKIFFEFFFANKYFFWFIQFLHFSKSLILNTIIKRVEDDFSHSSSPMTAVQSTVRWLESSLQSPSG